MGKRAAVARDGHRDHVPPGLLWLDPVSCTVVNAWTAIIVDPTGTELTTAEEKLFAAEKWIVESVKEDYSQRARLLIIKTSPVSSPAV